MAEARDPLSQALSDVLTGAYMARRLKQEVLVERTGMSIWTLQKKLKGRAPITGTDLIVISRAIGIEPGKVIEEAEELVAQRVSVPSPTVDDLSSKRAERIDRIRGDEFDEGAERSAANFDLEHEHDEPGAP